MNTVDKTREVGKVTVSTAITAELCTDLVSTAYESGYPWYRGWERPQSLMEGEYMHDFLLRTGRVALRMEDPEREGREDIYILSFDDIVRGIQEYVDFRAKQGIGIIPDAYNWDYDANDADCIIQFACYEDIIYG